MPDIDQPEVQAFRAAFGRNLRSLRRAARLTQAQLQARCFLHYDRISVMESGGATPSLELLMLLRDGLGVSVEDLTCGLLAPARAAGRAQMLALLALQPSNTPMLSKSSGLSTAYVLDLLVYLAAYGEIDNAGGRWQRGVRHDERPNTR
jgi:transcriptional regulator with XRE-family HTH domain